MLAAVVHVSCYLVGETSSCSKALGAVSPAVALTGRFLGSAGGEGSQVEPYPSHSKVVPAEGCAKLLEGVGACGSISGLLLFRIFPLSACTFEWR